MTKKRHHKKAFYIFIIVLIFFISLFFLANKVLTKTFTVSYDAKKEANALLNKIGDVVKAPDPEPEPAVLHVAPPKPTKAIYMTACVAGTKNFRQDLVDIIDKTEINSVIIDIKDFSGTISYDTGKNMQGESGPGCRSSDMVEFVKTLHEKGIYVIGRVTVFQDPYYSKLHPELAVKKLSDGAIWKDHKGLNFIDVGAKPYWDYILELSEVSHSVGFDEINFDYIRFPSDGDMKDIYFSWEAELLKANPKLGKQMALENFYKYLRDKINEYNAGLAKNDKPLIISADLFGMVTTNYDDLGIGQVLERALPYFDYIYPMVYPSHYPKGFNGWANPNNVPHDLIKYVMSAAYNRVLDLKEASSTPQVVRDFVSTEQLRPWIQDFDYGGNYGPTEVRSEIQATYESGLDSWLVWSPSNKYTVDAFKTDEGAKNDVITVPFRPKKVVPAVTATSTATNTAGTTVKAATGAN